MIYYARLNHGLNECVEVNRDCTLKQKFGASLRASLWKMFREEDLKGVEGIEVGTLKHNQHMLFVTKSGDQS